MTKQKYKSFVKKKKNSFMKGWVELKKMILLNLKTFLAFQNINPNIKDFSFFYFIIKIPNYV